MFDLMAFFRRLLASEYLIFVCSIVLILIASPLTPGFATFGNCSNLLMVLSPLLLAAFGLTIVMIAGGIDLSITATIAFTSICGAGIMSSDVGLLRGSSLAVPAAILCMLLAGGMVGLFNGIAIAYLKMPAFMVSLTTMIFLFGFATWLTGSRNIDLLPESFVVPATSVWITLPFTIGVAALAYLFLSQSIFGRWLIAIGQNRETSIVSGVPTKPVLVGSYLVSGLFAATASMLYMAQLETGSPTLAKNLLLDVVGAVVIGGTSLFGGRGKLQWTFGGVLFITLLDNVLNLQNLSHSTVMMAKGMFILLAASVDTMRYRWSKT